MCSYQFVDVFPGHTIEMVRRPLARAHHGAGFFLSFDAGVNTPVFLLVIPTNDIGPSRLLSYQNRDDFGGSVGGVVRFGMGTIVCPARAV